MRNAILTGLTAVIAAATIAAPAHAQSGPTPTIKAGPCKVRHSVEGKGFTYASCLISLDNVPQGKAIKLTYKSNLKTYDPHAEFGRWSKTTGTVTLIDGEIVGRMLAFPNKSAAQVRKSFKLTVSNATPGLSIPDAVATA